MLQVESCRTQQPTQGTCVIMQLGQQNQNERQTAALSASRASAAAVSASAAACGALTVCAAAAAAGLSSIGKHLSAFALRGRAGKHRQTLTQPRTREAVLPSQDRRLRTGLLLLRLDCARARCSSHGNSDKKWFPCSMCCPGSISGNRESALSMCSGVLDS
eukprot:6807-Heterococcus_DN1.PRE.3